MYFLSECRTIGTAYENRRMESFKSDGTVEVWNARFSVSCLLLPPKSPLDCTLSFDLPCIKA